MTTTKRTPNFVLLDFATNKEVTKVRGIAIRRDDVMVKIMSLIQDL